MTDRNVFKYSTTYMPDDVLSVSEKEQMAVHATLPARTEITMHLSYKIENNELHDFWVIKIS